MDIRYLESLISVAELGSIARAARAQNLTPAAVGQRIAILEKHFGTTLLNRSAHKAVPTEACINLLPGARQIISQFYEMSAQIEPAGMAGKFNLGSISTALTGILPGTIRQLAQVAPKLVLQIKPGTSNSLFADLSERNIDAAIIALPPYDLPRSFDIEVLRVEPLVLLSANASGKDIREKIEQNPYICYDAQSWGGLKAFQYLKDQKIRIEPFYELDALEAIEKLVLQGMGVSLVPRWAGLDLDRAGLEADIIDTDRYCRKVVLVTPTNSARPQIIDALRNALKSSQES
ncbi:MAG: LysR family transcriptional regulator [Gammaproteobacteria bacterium]|nr:LysR family transcriptional regulator [Gammaproteobacteria bacterium]